MELHILETLEDQVDPKITALLAIDLQNDYIAMEGKLGKIGLNMKLTQKKG